MMAAVVRGTDHETRLKGPAWLAAGRTAHPMTNPEHWGPLAPALSTLCALSSAHNPWPQCDLQPRSLSIKLPGFLV